MDIDAFILIGGRSARFGTDKAFVELDGETLAARAAKTVETALSPRHVTFVAASDAQFDDKVPIPLHYPIVADLRPGFGAWSGLHTALAYTRAEWAFVLACDLPFVTPEFINLLAASADEACDAVVPAQSDGRSQPLCALYRVRPQLAAVEAVLDGRHSLPALASIFDDTTTRLVGPDKYGELKDAGRFFTNVNTPNDLRNAQRIHRLR